MSEVIRPIPGERSGAWLPVRLSIDESSPELLSVRVGRCGRVDAIYAGRGYSRSELAEAIREAIEQHWASLLPRQDWYWRGTTNRREIALIRSGAIRASIDHSSGRPEAGLSVALHFGYAAMLYPLAYRVRGRVVGRGADGEPVLALDSLQPLDRAPRPVREIEGREGAARRAALEAVLASAGWTEDQYRAALWAVPVATYRYDAGEMVPA